MAEDASDWLYGHENDQHQWLTNYAAAIYIEQCAGLIVRDSRVWHGQNGLCLDRVSDSKIYDNDFSFNSGWGIALWRSSRNVISVMFPRSSYLYSSLPTRDPAMG